METLTEKVICGQVWFDMPGPEQLEILQNYDEVVVLGCPCGEDEDCQAT